MTPAELTTHLRRQRYAFGSEAMLQLSIVTVLERSGLEFEREVRLAAKLGLPKHEAEHAVAACNPEKAQTVRAARRCCTPSARRAAR